MRAIFIENCQLSVGDLIDVEGDNYTHLAKVCRVRQQEAVKILTGTNKSYVSEIISIGKRNLQLKVNLIETSERSFLIDICLGLPKREAFELSLKNSVELGVRRLIPFIADYSQWNIKNFDRIEALVESAIIQSNNPHSFSVSDPAANIESLSEIFNEYDFVILASLSTRRDKILENLIASSKTLVVIGPEGGLSKREEDYILALENSRVFNTNGPIMRTPNAVSASVGFVLGKIAGL